MAPWIEAWSLLEVGYKVPTPSNGMFLCVFYLVDHYSLTRVLLAAVLYFVLSSVSDSLSKPYSWIFFKNVLWKLDVARKNRPSLSLITEACCPKKIKEKKVPHGGKKKFFSHWHANLRVALQHSSNPLNRLSLCFPAPHYFCWISNSWASDGTD